MGTLKLSSQSLMSNCKCAFTHDAVVPSYNDKVNELHSAARDAYLIRKRLENQDKGMF